MCKSRGGAGCVSECGRCAGASLAVVAMPTAEQAPARKLAERLQDDVQKAIDALEDVYPAVSIFGGARVKEGSKAYSDAREIARAISEKGVSIITGGGPGVMEAGNRGCMDAGEIRGRSIGLNIRLPFEQKSNPFQDIELHFDQFASRKVMFARTSMAYVVCAGGVGTLDELFEILTLMQTKKMPRRPVILFDSAVWGPLVAFLDEVIKENGWMSEEDTKLYTLADTVPEILEALHMDKWPEQCDPSTFKQLSI